MHSEVNKYAIDKLGVLFTEYSVDMINGRITLKPQLETENNYILHFQDWHLFEMIYTARGDEKFIIFGQFNKLEDLTVKTIIENGSISTWSFFDDISLIDCTPIIAITIPNIFTPNGDGQNDNFTATIENAESVNIIIYNRWGAEVFVSQDPNFSWDGTFDNTPVADGVYFVIIQATSLTGENVTEKQTLHLMR